MLLRDILLWYELGRHSILTNGFVKKTQKTPKVEIECAKTYRDDYVERCDKNEKKYITLTATNALVNR